MLKSYFSTFVFAAILILISPIIFTYVNNTGMINLQNAVLGTIGLSIFLYFILNIIYKINALLAKIITSILFVSSFLIRLTYALIYDFSGNGFSHEFYTHFSMHSLSIGFKNYLGTITGLFVVIALLLFVLLKKQQKNTTSLTRFMAFVVSITLIFLSRDSLPEWKFVKGYWDYHSTTIETKDTITIRKETQNILKPLRAINDLPVNKNQLVANIPEKPKNVIIIYLESFSNILTENSLYPQLTPRIDRLKKEYVSFSHNYSSATVTIEGIANSQCGTLMNMTNGNNALTTTSGRLHHLPCLGDVLKEAGYHQVYYGGANLNFSGKGAFLKDHGYDEVWGLNEWKTDNIGPMNAWGLTDSSLFDQALKKVLLLHKQSKPFNLTLLTLGTHIPGFVYASCQPYSNSDDTFINAVHCTDYLVGQFIDQLKMNNVLDDTLVYIQGDHPIFSTHDMKQLFNDQTDDTRVLTVILDQDQENHEFEKDQTTSTYNMASNILDLLEIDHNANFILGQSDFSPITDKSYVLSRKSDFYQNQQINNHKNNTDCKNTFPDKISLPLDSCEKKHVMTSIYRLNASYAINNSQMHCTLGTEISLPENASEIIVRWGDQNLSQQFYLEGRRLKEPKPGIYLLELDKNDNVTNQNFYRHTNKNDMLILFDKLKTPGNRFVLLGHLTTEQLSKVSWPYLPLDFSQTRFLYAHNINGIITPLINHDAINFPLVYTPQACLDEADQYREEQLCEIEDWGPKQIVLGDDFNQLKNGNSAFWFKTNCMDNKPIIRLDNTELKTRIRLPISTAEIDRAKLIKKAKSYQLELYDQKSNKTQNIGVFTALEKIKGPYIIPMENQSKVNKPPLLIAHAGGGFNNQNYLNTIEALDHNYELGHRLFEIDFNWTNDEKIVAIHDWGKTFSALFNSKIDTPPSHEEFMALPMVNHQTQIDLLMLNAWLETHQDARIITDIRGKNLKALTLIKNHITNAEIKIIPQLYHPKNLEDIKKLGFKGIIFTLYATQLSNNDLLRFIKQADLYAVTIHPSKMNYDNLIKNLADTDTFIYVHTINTIEELDDLLSKGIDGVYTDFLYSNKANSVMRQ